MLTKVCIIMIDHMRLCHHHFEPEVLLTSLSRSNMVIKLTIVHLFTCQAWTEPLFVQDILPGIFAIFLGISSGILSSISADILSGILSDLLTGILPGSPSSIFAAENLLFKYEKSFVQSFRLSQSISTKIVTNKFLHSIIQWPEKHQSAVKQ